LALICSVRGARTGGRKSRWNRKKSSLSSEVI
jgi:hypothetical protein